MVKKIKSLSELRIKLERSRVVFAVELAIALNKATQKVRADAQSKFGSYQPAIGQFPEWAKLSENYLKQKLKYGGEDPLIGHYGSRGGNKIYPTPLRSSIMAQVKDFKGYVGTNDPLGEWHEFGTSRGIPPRPFLRPALYENRDYIKELFRIAIANSLR